MDGTALRKTYHLIKKMDGLPSPGATATASSISATAGGSAIRTISSEAYLILGSFGPSIFPAFSPKIILMG